MQIVKTYPSVLRREVKFFYTARATQKEHGNAVQPRLPDGTLDIVFNFGDPVLISGNETGFLKMPDISVTGLYHNRNFLIHNGEVHLTGVVFNPGFANLFISDRLSLYEKSTCDASLIFGNPIRQLAQHLHDLRDETEKHKVLECFLFSLVRGKKSNYHLGSINEILKEIHSRQGHVQMNAMAKDHFMSERNFRRKFYDLVGLSPKKYASIIRVKSFCKLYKEKRVSLQEMAYQLNYADTSHLYKDFQKIAGSNPTSFFNQLGPIGAEFIDFT